MILGKVKKCETKLSTWVLLMMIFKRE